jgi:hypothetical protein
MEQVETLVTSECPPLNHQIKSKEDFSDRSIWLTLDISVGASHQIQPILLVSLLERISATLGIKHEQGSGLTSLKWAIQNRLVVLWIGRSPYPHN